jgi:hypothetical protein
VPSLTRRQVLSGIAKALGGAALAYVRHWFGVPTVQAQGSPSSRIFLPLVSGGADKKSDLFVARNGTPTANVQKVIELAGGITRYVGYDDAVVLKPNGQWPRQGYTHTESLKALIDLILNRPGGFGGEVILAEHVHRAPPPATDNALGTNYCWNMSAGSNRQNNWPDMNYFELVNDYHTRGFPNVTAIPLYDSGQGDFMAVTGPEGLPDGKQGWVRTTYTTAANGRIVRLSSAILRSAYSGKLIDLKNGVWAGGGYNGQRVTLIFLPTLNNHGSFNSEDYAGPTSALKCHLGIVDFAGTTGVSLHGVGYNTPISPQAMGESMGHLITQILSPAFYLTCAEYTGYRSRTDGTAANTRTVGLCADPVTLDYWMCKNILYPCATSQTFMNPDKDNNLRRALLGCQGKGVGTVNEGEMVVHQVSLV